VEALPVEALPVEALPVEALPVEALPVEAMPVETAGRAPGKAARAARAAARAATRAAADRAQGLRARVEAGGRAVTPAQAELEATAASLAMRGREATAAREAMVARRVTALRERAARPETAAPQATAARAAADANAERRRREHRVQWAKTRQFRPSREALTRVLSDATGATDPGVLAALEEEVEWVTLPRGDVLFREHTPGDSMFIIVSGRMRIHVGADEGDTTVAELGPGETVGEMALLSDAPRSANVSALRGSELLRLSKAGFAVLVAGQPRVMAGFARKMVERLSRSIKARSAVTQLRAMPLARPQDCAAVAATENLVLRNLKITQMYHRLSLEMTLLIGHQDANWCTFACNASKTAGYSIRGEELPFYEVLVALRRRPRLARAADRARDTLERVGLKARVDDMLEDVSRCISEGNLKVFVEIAGGQDLLAEAMSHYHDAMFESAPKRKAELILLANAKVGLHEQQRLQPNIVEGLDAPIHAGLGGVLTRLVVGPLAGVLPARITRAVEEVMNERERELLGRATAIWRRMVTRSMMTLRLPYGKVHLGRDMPRLPSEELFPDVLQRLELPELVALVKQYDYTQDALTGSGASDWGDIADRMNFILDLFRSRQKSLELFDQPFLYEHRLEMAADRVPVGRL
jgi:CRP-like cAMP-binding protein